MIVVTSLFAFILSLLESILLYYLGVVLTRPDETRSFLGLTQNDESPQKHARISSICITVGNIIKIIAVIAAISALFSTLFIIFT